MAISKTTKDKSAGHIGESVRLDYGCEVAGTSTMG